MDDAVEILDSPDGVMPEELTDFYVGWPTQPTASRRHAVLRGSSHVAIARAKGTGTLVGFACAISDGELAAYITLVEVLPEWQHRGIGSSLVRSLLDRLRGLYMVDLVCDEELRPFYERFGFRHVSGMVLRDRSALDEHSVVEA